jgi:hypothetical protein
MDLQNEEWYPRIIATIQDEATGRPFEVTIHYVITEGGISIKRISADIDQDTSGDLTSTQLRKIRIGELRVSIQRFLLGETRSEADWWAASEEKRTSTSTPEELSYMRAEMEKDAAIAQILRTERPKRGRGVDNQDWYGHIARVYLDFHAEHGQRTVKAMAEYLDAAPNTVYWWVRKAREEGWLTEGRQGRAGAGPGPRLIAWMQAQEEER